MNPRRFLKKAEAVMLKSNDKNDPLNFKVDFNKLSDMAFVDEATWQRFHAKFPLFKPIPRS